MHCVINNYIRGDYARKETAEMPHEDYFHAVSAYCQATYGYEPDKSCKDVSRACFLPYAPDIYINPELLPSHE